MRIPITRQLADGTITDGTAELTRTHDGATAHDFRDLDGKPLNLPPGAKFNIPVPDSAIVDEP